MTAPKIVQRARPAILALKAYSSARSLAQPDPATVFLDANELPAEPLIGVKGYARYSPQQPPALMKALSEIYGVDEDRIMAARGADEAIDVLIRAFCEAGQDNIVICPPTFPMYAQSARWQGAEIKTAKLKADFSSDVAAILKTVDKKTKIVFLCSPNNPTGGIVKKDVVVKLCKALKDKALLALDEAYIEFCPDEARTALLDEYDNLVIFRTLSKGYALAGVRCGAMLAHPEIVALCRKVLAPYPLAVPALETVLKTLAEPNRKRLALKRQEILATRDWFVKKLKTVSGITKIYPSDTNYVLVRCKDAKKILAIARENGFILRDQSHQPTLENCVRISMGTQEQMEDLLHVLKTGKHAAVKTGRRAAITRRTNETAISVTVDLDHADPVHISTGVGFYDHMLEQIAKHGGFSLVLECSGDLHIDAHHTIEDCAIALGQALKQALGDKAGIGRYGFTVPMDEALAQAVIDLSGRGLIRFEGDFPENKVGDMPTDMVAHVFRSLAENMQATIHISVDGENTHHMVEGCFKAFGRALRQAIRREGDSLPSTKGMLLIAIVDSGGANLASVIFAIERLGKPFVFTADPDEIAKASHVILPGVGAAGSAMKTLRERELIECLRKLTQPVLGICLGMQLLFERSEEGDVDLLGLLSARVQKFKDIGLPVPHMGWNTFQALRENPLLKGLPEKPYAYFVHSYYAPPGDYTLARTDYGIPFSSVVNRGNLFGCQFHPERSGRDGSLILKNFVEL